MNKRIIHQSNINYRKYLFDLHNSFGTSTDILREIISEGTGYKPLKSKRIINGESNEIYDVLLTNKQSVIIKISRPKTYLKKILLNDFKKEQWVNDQCKKLDLPVAQVIFLKKYTFADEEFSVCIQEKLEGKALNDLLVEDLSDLAELSTVAIELGGLSSKIHSIKTQGFGDMDGTGTGEYKTWSEFIFNLEKNKERFYECADNLRLEKEIIDESFEILQQYSYIYESVQPRLLYGDFNPRNVLVQNLKITGLIDFEHSMSGDPIFDIARWDYFYDFHEFDTTLIIDKYSNKDLFGGNFLLKFHLYKLRFGLDILDYFDQKKNDLGIKVAKKNLRNDLKYFRSYNGIPLTR